MIICFGEILIRFAPQLPRGWLDENHVASFIGGAELNVALALANWGKEVAMVTALPDNFLSYDIVHYLQTKQVNTSLIPFTGDRIGLYYLPQGGELKGSNVLFDRKGSSFATLSAEQLDWDRVCQQATWLHLSSIVPSLNDSLAAIAQLAMATARRRDVPVSFDLNYRSQLWDQQRNAPQVIHPLISHVDLLLGNLWSVKELLGIESGIDEFKVPRHPLDYLHAADRAAFVLYRRYPNLKRVCFNFRMEDRYWAILYEGGLRHVSQIYTLHEVVDRAGSGDCFMAALIYGLQQGMVAKSLVDFACAAAVGKLAEHGDHTQQTIESIQLRTHANRSFQ